VLAGVPTHKIREEFSEGLLGTLRILAKEAFYSEMKDHGEMCPGQITRVSQIVTVDFAALLCTFGTPGFFVRELDK
jgi:hypothetical protein